MCVHTCTHQSKPKMLSYKTNSLLRRDLEHLAKWQLMTKPLKNHGCPLLTKVIFSEKKKKVKKAGPLRLVSKHTQQAPLPPAIAGEHRVVSGFNLGALMQLIVDGLTMPMTWEGV